VEHQPTHQPQNVALYEQQNIFMVRIHFMCYGGQHASASASASASAYIKMNHWQKTLLLNISERFLYHVGKDIFGNISQIYLAMSAHSSIMPNGTSTSVVGPHTTQSELLT